MNSLTKRERERERGEENKNKFYMLNIQQLIKAVKQFTS